MRMSRVRLLVAAPIYTGSAFQKVFGGCVLGACENQFLDSKQLILKIYFMSLTSKLGVGEFRAFVWWGTQAAKGIRL